MLPQRRGLQNVRCTETFADHHTYDSTWKLTRMTTPEPTIKLAADTYPDDDSAAQKPDAAHDQQVHPDEQACEADAFMDEEDSEAVAERLRQLGYI